MTFAQRLPAAFYSSVQADVRSRLAAAGLVAGLFDDPDDVAYLTGFFHFPNERPVAVWLSSDSVVLLVPELEREYAEHQRAAAELVSYPEFPGVRPPFTVLAAEVGAPGGPVGYGDSTTTGRLAAMRAAGFDSAVFERTDAVQAARLVKRPEEIALHREAARITDLMLAAGRERVSHAMRGRSPLPTEAELAALGVNIHEPPWLEDGDDSVLAHDMIVSDEPGLYVPGLAGFRISDSVLVGDGPLTAYPKNLDDIVIAS
jgi:Xaa-Pro aminopeptidase